jgi:hypothetical protein
MAKTLVYEGWKSLDFLGFSRANRAFSMGYARFSLKEISRPLLPQVAAAAARTKDCDCAYTKWRNCSSVELNVLSVFPQYLAV